MALPVCPKCGSTNAVGASYCTKCGSPLPALGFTPVQPPVVPPSSVYPPVAPGYPYDFDSIRSGTQISRTKTGLLLIIIGILIGPIPYVGFVGGILALVGAILVILGREAFGKPHSSYTIWSVVLYVVGFFVIVAFGVAFAFSLIAASLRSGGTTNLSQVLTPAINNFLLGALIGGAITGLAYVLFTYALQETPGRILLWVGYVATLAVGILVFTIVGADIATVVSEAVSGGVYNPGPINDLQAQVRYLQLLNFIPALLNGAAYYLAWSRLNRGELPKPKV